MGGGGFLVPTSLRDFLSLPPSVPSLGIYSNLSSSFLHGDSPKLFLRWGNKEPTDDANSGPTQTDIIRNGQFKVVLNCDGFYLSRNFPLDVEVVSKSNPIDNTGIVLRSETYGDRSNIGFITFRTGYFLRIFIGGYDSNDWEFRAVLSFFIGDVLFDNLFIEAKQSVNQVNNPVSYFHLSRFRDLLRDLPALPEKDLEESRKPIRTGDLPTGGTGEPEEKNTKNKIIAEIQNLNIKGIIELYQLIIPGLSLIHI